jgi:hypothetical protein
MPSENSKQKTIACPNCAKSFQITLGEGGGDDNDNVLHKTTSNKRQRDQQVVEKTMLIVKVC